MWDHNPSALDMPAAEDLALNQVHGPRSPRAAPDDPASMGRFVKGVDPAVERRLLPCRYGGRVRPARRRLRGWAAEPSPPAGQDQSLKLHTWLGSFAAQLTYWPSGVRK